MYLKHLTINPRLLPVQMTFLCFLLFLGIGDYYSEFTVYHLLFLYSDVFDNYVIGIINNDLDTNVNE